jgi:fumarate hydratase class I
MNFNKRKDEEKRVLELPLNDYSLTEDFSCGQEIFISGIIFTGRDAFHKFLCSSSPPPDFLKPGSAIYHCGPIVSCGKNGKFELIAAGPTTSWRMGAYAAKIIEKFGIKIFIGKGGMGTEFTKVCAKNKGLYLNFPGGCAQSACKYICEIRNVYFLKEFGPAEAVYELRVEKMPLIVTIDSKGNNMHLDIMNSTKEQLKKISMEY